MLRILHAAEIILLFMIIIHVAKVFARDWRALLQRLRRHRAVGAGKGEKWAIIKLIATFTIAGITAAAPVLYYSLEWMLKLSARGTL